MIFVNWYLIGFSQKMTTKFKVLVLNGPNLNMLGKREPEIYGAQSLSDIIDNLSLQALPLSIELSHLQSNAEHLLIEKIHNAHNEIDFIIINPAAFTHTSIAIRDALLSVDIPFIEVHLSNVHTREKFRHHSYLSDKAIGVICGLGANGYKYALQSAYTWLIEHKN
jgi:3-dehydroquinate dehydratase-2